MLQLGVDLGSSRSKVFYRRTAPHRELQGWFLHPAAVTPITASVYERSHFLCDDNTSLIGVSGKYWMVGAQARNAVCLSENYIKSSDALPRLLAIIGRTASLTECTSKLSVIIQLPLDEREGYSSTEEALRDALQGFDFNGTRLEVGCDRIKVFPEGAGMQSLMKKERVSILVFGHKDVSIEHVRGGTIDLASSRTLTGHGMIRLLTSIPGLIVRDDVEISQALCLEARTGKGIELITQEVDGMRERYNEAVELLWLQLSQYFNSDSMLSLSEQIIATGGNAPFWKERLKQHFGRKLDIGRVAIAEMKQRFPELAKNSMVYCGLDLYCLWKRMFKIADATDTPQIVKSLSVLPPAKVHELPIAAEPTY